MRSKSFLTAVYFGIVTISGLCAAEKVLSLGAAAGWNAAEKRSQVDEITALRPYPVLALSPAWTGSTGEAAGAALQADSAARPASHDELMALYSAYRNFPSNESVLDLSLSFDGQNPARFHDGENRYSVEVSQAVQSAGGRWARYGTGAALFSGVRSRGSADPVTIRPQSRDALFQSGRNMRDFSIEFWLYPNNLENGEQILAWTADWDGAGPGISGKTGAAAAQRIYCEAVRNRLRWTFRNFFVAPDSVPGKDSPAGAPQTLSISLESRQVLVPRIWTHHIVRYSADTGLLEYLVNGQIENVAYTTASGRDSGGVYTPYAGRDGLFVLGGRFSGLIDEFRVYRRSISAPGRTALDTAGRVSLELPDLAKFPRNGGRIETRALDLGERGSSVLRLEVSGGRWTAPSTGLKAAKNSYAGKGNFNFPDNSAVQFFIKAGEEPYRFEGVPWIPVAPGAELSGRLYGRYIQFAAVLYPSGDRETTPYLEEVRIVYENNEAPWPPSLVTARTFDGAVELNWRPSPDSDATGYLVYYGTSSGVYYGEGAVLGESPIDAGKRTNLRIDGLKNGTLYFFAVAAYDGKGPQIAELHPGKFSKEVTARPLRTSE